MLLFTAILYFCCITSQRLFGSADFFPSTDTPENSTGLKFVFAFPENIAYYHPVQPENKVQITALHNNTEVTFIQYTFTTLTKILGAGQIQDFIFDSRLELLKSEITEKTLQITSTKPITVHAIIQKANSVQTALVIPTDKLGKKYLVPPVPEIQGTTRPADKVTEAVTERNPFKLIIVNADQDNKVTVEGAEMPEVLLEPHQIAQIWVKQLQVVKAEQPVAVLFGHPCAIRSNCTCGLLYTMLPPVQEEKLKFYIPPALAEKAEGETFVLLSEESATTVKAFNPDSPLVEITGTAVLYRPGLLLTLIPETDFAACSAVRAIPDAENFAVIVVHKDLTDGVRVGSLPLQSPVWQDLKGTDYVSTRVVLAAGKNVIWHASSKMAVYFLGKKAYESS